MHSVFHLDLCVRVFVCVCVPWFLVSDPILLQLHAIVAGHHPAGRSPQGSNDTVKEGGGDGETFVENFETARGGILPEQNVSSSTHMDGMRLYFRMLLLLKSTAYKRRVTVLSDYSLLALIFISSSTEANTAASTHLSSKWRRGSYFVE